MKALPIYEQPQAEWLGEAYVAVTPETIKEMVIRINDHPTNPEHELSDFDCLRLFENRGLLFWWLSRGMAAFVPYDKCQVYIGDRIRTYDIEDIEIAAPKVSFEGCPEGEECFVIHLRYW